MLILSAKCMETNNWIPGRENLNEKSSYTN